MKRGYFGIGIYHGKTIENLGTLWRSAHNFGAAFLFTIGPRYKTQASDTTKAFRHIPLYNYKTFAEFNRYRPYAAPLVAIEQTRHSYSTINFVHPEQAIYMLGAEDHGIHPAILKKCQSVIHIDTPLCLNVAVAGSIIMYDRSIKKI